MRLYYLLFLFLFSISQVAISQDLQGIKDPEDQFKKKCQTCITWLRTAPREVQYGFYRDDFDNLFFYITNEEWFKKLLTSSSDGLAADIVSKERYACNKRKPTSSFPRGKILKPKYQKELFNKMTKDAYGNVIIPFGKIPDDLKNKEIEYNIIFIKNKYLCHYHHAINVDAAKWGLIDLGFYLDTLTYQTKFDTTVTSQEKYILDHKIKKFEIRFEKNKSTYSKSDLNELYESLKLSAFDIQNIKIRAYSSIEGSYEHNIELQENRSKSIITALQEFQDFEITQEINASENWVEFLNDIVGTKFAYLSSLTKEEIKTKLENKQLATEIEPILKNHRKGVVILELQKKNLYKDLKTDVLISLFNDMIKEKNLSEANEIQHSLVEKLRDEELPSTYLNKLEIPNQSDFGLLLQNNSMYKYLLDEKVVYETYLELLNLQDLLPDDGHVKYNLCALKFKLWFLGTQTIDPKEFYTEISNLISYGIDASLVKRMQINYHIVMSEISMIQGNYLAKDKSVNFIKKNYSLAHLKDGDMLSVAKYFCSYSKYQWATTLLHPKAFEIDCEEDILFYYLSLTLNNDQLVRKSNYRTIMLNAININKDRFCAIFNSHDNGGASFQLLENNFLKKTYCENCWK